MIDKEQQLLAKILDLIAQKFDKRAILRGGMVLRILGSPRLTNDLDYVFVPYKSKKDIVEEIVECLKTLPATNVTYSLNSKCLRVVVVQSKTTVQLEAKVAMEADVTPLSTRLFSPLFDLPKRMIQVVDLPIALSNKMAAWNERRLIRDLYDIWFFLKMNILPDQPTLEKRLNKPQYSKLIRSEDYFPGSTCDEFYAFLRENAALLTDIDIKKELRDYLPDDETTGLAMLIRAALTKLDRT